MEGNDAVVCSQRRGFVDMGWVPGAKKIFSLEKNLSDFFFSEGLEDFVFAFFFGGNFFFFVVLFFFLFFRTILVKYLKFSLQ